MVDGSGQSISGHVALISAEAMDDPAATLGRRAQVKTRDGAFEFRDIPSGQWVVSAEAERGEVKLRGFAPPLLLDADVEDLRVSLAAPITVKVLVEPGEADEALAVELHPSDIPIGAVFANQNSDHTLTINGAYPGRYRVLVFDNNPKFYLQSVLFREQDVLGKNLTLTGEQASIRLNFRPSSNAGVLQGMVDGNCPASILLLPADETMWTFQFIRQGECDATGHFEIPKVRSGNYYALALDRIVAAGLDNLVTLRRLAAEGVEVQIDENRAAYKVLKIVTWPD
jgi:hypothetical protein